jgi:hypothetical protein
MDEYYDDEYNDEIKPSKKSFITNPAGPYKIEIIFKGINYDITIQNISYKEFDIKAIAKDVEEDYNEEDIMMLNKYLNDEGFLLAATKWNIYYK